MPRITIMASYRNTKFTCIFNICTCTYCMC